MKKSMLSEKVMNGKQGKKFAYCLECIENCSRVCDEGKEWGYCQTERKAEKFVNNWFKMIAFRLVQIANKVGYNLTNIY